MAFVGRVNSFGNYVDSELFNPGRSSIHTMPPQTMDEESKRGARRTKCSRTYIKTYDSEPCKLVTNSGTLRLVAGSASSCEVKSLDDTEMSTLRYCSQRSWETETATLTPQSSPDGSSLSGGSGGEAVPSNKLQISQEAVVHQQYDVEWQQLEKGSTTSMCSWEVKEEEDEVTASVFTSVDSGPSGELSNSCCVPQLELGSDTVSLDYEQHQEQLDQLKAMRQSNEAYNKWLSGKKRQSLYKQRAAEQERQKKQEEEAMRQQLNQQRVQAWYERKARETANNKANTNTANNQAQTLTEETRQSCLQSWELNKIKQAALRRQQQQHEALLKEQLQEQRKQQASMAWQHWFKNVAQRPKPVPLNQGLHTLRGTISSIYVNPNPWVHVNEQTKI